MDDPGRTAAFLNERDLFCRACGIRLLKAEPGYAEAELCVTEKSLNANQVVQGGAIFTLADFCFAGAANAGRFDDGAACVSRHCDIVFLRPGTGKTLRAVARAVRDGSRSALYRVEIFDEKERLVAYCLCDGTVTGNAVYKEDPKDG